MPPRERRSTAGEKSFTQKGRGHLSGWQLKLLLGALRDVLSEDKEKLKTGVLGRTNLGKFFYEAGGKNGTS